MKPLAIVVLELQFESCGCREKSISYDSCLSLKFVLPSPEAFCKNIQVLFLPKNLQKSIKCPQLTQEFCKRPVAYALHNSRPQPRC